MLSLSTKPELEMFILMSSWHCVVAVGSCGNGMNIIRPRMKNCVSCNCPKKIGKVGR